MIIVATYDHLPHHYLFYGPQELAARKLANRTLGGRQGVLMMMVLVMGMSRIVMMVMMVMISNDEDKNGDDEEEDHS